VARHRDPSFENFGRNVRFSANAYFEPRTELDVLALLWRNAGKRFRVTGSLHSWSEAAAGGDVVLNLRHLDEVRVDGARPGLADIGAGCSVNRALSELRKQNLILPAFGMAGEQTLAGAISTATHGSGRPSMSHYVAAVRVAAFDERGRPVIRELTGGRALEAARCALGRCGIMLRVRMRCETIAEVLQQAARHPLTQFYLIPWAWSWIVQLRRRADVLPSALPARWRHRAIGFLFRVLVIDALAWLCARVLNRPAWLRGVYRLVARHVMPLAVVARADRVLLTHHYFRYVETELFVPADRVAQAAALIETVLAFAGDGASIPQADKELLDPGELASLEKLRGRYVHHYPITFRRVEQDATLISMSSDESMYAISLITFERDIVAFEAVAGLLAVAMSRMFGARLHWGKLFPHGAEAQGDLIPGLAPFAEECRALDPHGAFRSAFTERVLGF
jgi:hypothetical protein